MQLNTETKIQMLQEFLSFRLFIVNHAKVSMEAIRTQWLG